MAFLTRQNQYRPATKESLGLVDKLPPGNFVLKKDMQGYFLEHGESFVLPKKLYGDAESKAKRIFNTFLDRPNTTGILLAGEKGSGKSLTGQIISCIGYEQNIPTIIVNEPHHGDEFNSFIQSISIPSIIFIDEFEKVYSDDDNVQQQLLTLLDGSFPSKKMFLLTCNDKWQVNHHCKNRPGRIYYFLEFEGIEQNFVREYCNDQLNNKANIDSVCTLSSIFAKFNFDMLKALVEEMNRYNESTNKSMEMLNIKLENDLARQYQIFLKYKGKTVIGSGDKHIVALQPLIDPFNISYINKDINSVNIDSVDIDDNEVYVTFDPSNIVTIDKDGTIFLKKDLYEGYLKRVVERTYSYDRFL